MSSYQPLNYQRNTKRNYDETEEKCSKVSYDETRKKCSKVRDKKLENNISPF